MRRDDLGEFLEVLDLDGADLAALRGANVLDGHQQGVSDIIGVIDDARREGNEIIARLRMSTRPELAPIVRDISEGVIRNVSVGYSVAEWKTSRANGQRTKTATRWTPREVSFVAVPADRNAHTRNEPMNERITINRQIRELATRAGAATSVADDLIDRQASRSRTRALRSSTTSWCAATFRSGRTAVPTIPCFSVMPSPMRSAIASIRTGSRRTRRRHSISA